MKNRIAVVIIYRKSKQMYRDMLQDDSSFLLKSISDITSILLQFRTFVDLVNIKNLNLLKISDAFDKVMDQVHVFRIL